MALSAGARTWRRHCLAAKILEKAAQIAVICAGTGNKVYELSCEDVDVMHDFMKSITPNVSRAKSRKQ